jgi:hypothetical protein
MEENGKGQESDNIADEQASGEDIVPAEEQRRKQDERRGDTGGPCPSCPSPFAEKLIETCHSIMLSNKCPYECAKQDLTQVPLRRIKHGPVNKFANHHPEPPSEAKGKDREEIDPYLQKKPVYLDAQDHGHESFVMSLARSSPLLCSR